MPSLLTARRRARPRVRSDLTLHGVLATDARYIVGAKGAHAAPNQAAYLMLHPDGSASLVREDVVPDRLGVPPLSRSDCTLGLLVGRAPMELDVHALRQALSPGMPVQEYLRLRRDRSLVAEARLSDAEAHLCLYNDVSAITRAVFWMDDMFRGQAFSTGRQVRFADDVLSPLMFRLVGAVTPSSLKVLAIKTERRSAKANVRLLGVLPWLQAQVAPSPAKTRQLRLHS